MATPADEVNGVVRSVTKALSSAENTANRALNDARLFMASLSDGVGNIDPPDIALDLPPMPSAPALAAAEAPTLATVPGSVPNPPNLTLSEFTPSSVLPEPFTGTAPQLVIGTVPSFSGAAPDAPPIDTGFEVPEFAGITLPAAPDLLNINIAPFGGTNIPTFTGTAPTLNVAEPTIREYIPGADYTSSLLTTISASLEDRITNGGTGLPASVEGAIWDREREREAIATRDALLELDRMEAMGFAFPPGQYTDARLKITTEMHARTISLGREIAIEQARLELENIKQALTLSVEAERMLLDSYNTREQRTFEALRYATEAGVSIYNAKVQGFAALVDAYQASIAVFEAEVRAALADVEAYKAIVDAEQAKASVNLAKVQAYTALIEGSLANVEVFKAEVQAITAQAEIERLKTDIYRSQVQAFATRVSAYTAEVEGFKAAVSAEGEKQNAFRAQVDAYTAEVQGAAAALAAEADGYRAEIAGYTARWEGYKAQAAAAADQARIIADQNSALIDAYRADTAGISAYNEVLTAQWEASVRHAQSAAEVGVAAAKANSDAYLTTRSLSLDASKVGAQVSAQMAAGAMAAVNYNLTGSGSAAISTAYGFDNDKLEQTIINV